MIIGIDKAVVEIGNHAELIKIISVLSATYEPIDWRRRGIGKMYWEHYVLYILSCFVSLLFCLLRYVLAAVSEQKPVSSAIISPAQ